MRLWHKDLISALPRLQLMSQWRECCCISKHIAENGTPNHILVNKIMNYDLKHFYTYGLYVCMEMIHRGYKCDSRKFDQYFIGGELVKDFSELFNEHNNEWHNERYLDQCYYNLQEKFDCGGMSIEEWETFEKKYYEVKEKYSILNKEMESW